MNTRYDVAIIGCGEAGIFAGYELMHRNPGLKVVTLDQGADIYTRSCPIVAGKVKECIHCKVCDTMCGFGGAGAFSDGKYNFTTAFGGWLTDFMPKREVMELIDYVDSINMRHGATDQVFSTETPAAQALEKKALEYDLHLLQARCKHLGTENNLKILQSIYEEVRQGVEFRFRTAVTKIENLGKEGYRLITDKGDEVDCTWLIAGPGRSGAEWFSNQCKELGIQLINNQVDIGVRVELPYEVFAHLTDELYESKIVYRTEKFQDRVRTFCMNPKGVVVNENTNGIVTVNGHSYEDPALHTENTNFALLVAKHFSEPFKDSNGYGESIARLSNMLGGGVIVQRFGDLIRGQRSTPKRVEESFVTPTLAATPGDLSLVMPKRILDGIIEMIYALDKIAPGTANDDTLLYGVEVKFYNMEVQLDENLETPHKGLFVIGDGSGVTHSLSHASASGVYVARHIAESL